MAIPPTSNIRQTSPFAPSITQDEFCNACRSGNIDAVRSILQSGIDVNATNKYGETPLYSACANGNLPIVKLLLSVDKIDVNIPDSYGVTPIHRACVEKNKAIVELLLKAHADIGITDTKFGKNAFAAACCSGDEAIVQLLLNSDAPIDLNVRDKNGNTPLHSACAHKHGAIVDILVQAGSNPDLTNVKGYTPLHIACVKEEEQVINSLIKAGASLNLIDHERNTPLHIACRVQNNKIVKMLIGAGADLNPINTTGESPLLIASENRQFYEKKRSLKIIKILLRSGANPNTIESGFTPIHYAVDHLPTLKLFLKNPRKVNLDLANRLGYTPLYKACLYGHKKAVELLLKAGANKEIPVTHMTHNFETENLTYKSGETPLDRAWLNKNHEIAMILLTTDSSYSSLIDTPAVSFEQEANKRRFAPGISG